MVARDTIFALSTPGGRSAIAIIRISGEGAGGALVTLAGPLPPPRQARLARLRDPKSGDVLDRALTLWFPGPASATGEDLAELHIHGGAAVTAGILGGLAALPGLRPAAPGEFTRRAFAHGKLDLTAVEGLSDLIAAETETQKHQALQQLDGTLARLVEGWRKTLTGLMARLEAEIDFPDEALDVGRDQDNARMLQALRDDIAGHLAESPRGERVREGYRVALLGAPNVGKSSLLNALAQRDVAIVTDEPGTTRDVLEVTLNLGGYAVLIADMAGLRDDPGRVEAIGIARARARAAEAELRLCLTDAPMPEPLEPAVADLMQSRDLVLRTKADLRAGIPALPGEMAISALTGLGLLALLDLIEARAVQALGQRDAPVFTRLRHRTALSDCLAALDRALPLWDTAPPELLAEDFRLAARALGQITGRIDVEEILDVVFAEFCIGK